MIFANKQLSALFFQGEYYWVSELCESNSVAAIHVNCFGKDQNWILVSYDKDGGERWRQRILSRETRTVLVDVPSGAVGHAVSLEGDPIIGIRDDGLLKTFKIIESERSLSLEAYRQYEYLAPGKRLVDYLDLDSGGSYKKSFSPTISDALFSDIRVKDDIEVVIERGSPGAVSDLSVSLDAPQVLEITKRCKTENALRAQQKKRPRFIPFYFNKYWVKSSFLPDNTFEYFPHATVDFSLFLTDQPEAKTDWDSLFQSAQKLLRDGDNLHTASASMLQAIQISQRAEVIHNVFIQKGHYQRSKMVFNSSLENNASRVRGSIVVFSAAGDARVANIDSPDLAQLSNSMNMNWISVRYAPGGHMSCPPLISEMINNLQTYIANGLSLERLLTE